MEKRRACVLLLSGAVGWSVWLCGEMYSWPTIPTLLIALSAGIIIGVIECQSR